VIFKIKQHSETFLSTVPILLEGFPVHATLFLPGSLCFFPTFLILGPWVFHGPTEYTLLKVPTRKWWDMDTAGECV